MPVRISGLLKNRQLGWVLVRNVESDVTGSSKCGLFGCVDGRDRAVAIAHEVLISDCNVEFVGEPDALLFPSCVEEGGLNR